MFSSLVAFVVAAAALFFLSGLHSDLAFRPIYINKQENGKKKSLGGKANQLYIVLLNSDQRKDSLLSTREIRTGTRYPGLENIFLFLEAKSKTQNFLWKL